MTSSWFDSSSTSKILNLSLLQFNERSEFENLAYKKKREGRTEELGPSLTNFE